MSSTAISSQLPQTLSFWEPSPAESPDKGFFSQTAEKYLNCSVASIKTLTGYSVSKIDKDRECWYYVKIVFKIISFIVLFPLFCTALGIKIWYRCSRPEFTIDASARPLQLPDGNANPAVHRHTLPALKTNDHQLRNLYLTYASTGEPMGSGKNGKVYNMHNGKVLKYVPSQFSQDKPFEYMRLENMLNEFYIGATLDHPNICKTHEGSQYPDKDPPYLLLVMDYIQGPTASALKHCSGYTIDQVILLLRQLQDCCLYVFAQRVVWDDFTDQNIMISEGQIKLIDFGFWNRYEAGKPLYELARFLLRYGQLHIQNLVNLLPEEEAKKLINSLRRENLCKAKNFNQLQRFLEHLSRIIPSTTDEAAIASHISDYFEQVIAVLG